MKKIITALLALLTIASCTKESTESYPSSGEVKFTTQTDLTRASEKTSWSNEETIGIYSAEYTNVQYKAAVNNTTVTFTPVSDAVYYSSHTSATEFYAYYPYDSNVTGNDVPFDLTTTNQVDMLWSTASATEGDDVEFTFDHVHSIIELTVSKGTDLESLSTLTITVGDSYSNGTLDVEDGTVTGDGTTSVAMDVTQNVDGTATASVIVMAYDYKTAAKNITITFSVYDRTFTQTLSPKWESGYKYKYSAEVGFNNITFTAGDITEWGTEVSDSTLASGYDIIISTEDEFQIYTAKGLAAFRDLVNKLSDNSDARIQNNSTTTYTFGTSSYYTGISGKLMNDINLEDICNETAGSWTPIGTSSYYYASTFDGNGCEVQGLYIDAQTTYQGLFGWITAGATIQNLGVRGSVTSTMSYTAGLVGHCYGKGTINLCYSAVTVSGANYTSGLVGNNNGGTIINSYNIGSVSSTNNNVGGVAGSTSTSAIIANCYNMSSVSGTGSCIGGVVGYNPGTTTNCYSVGSVSGSSYVGGVVGSNSKTISNCYYNTNYYGGLGVGYEYNDTTTETTALTSQEMKSEDFVKTLNDGVTNSDRTDLKTWKLGSDGYPVINTNYND